LVAGADVVDELVGRGGTRVAALSLVRADPTGAGTARVGAARTVADGAWKTDGAGSLAIAARAESGAATAGNSDVDGPDDRALKRESDATKNETEARTIASTAKGMRLSRMGRAEPSSAPSRYTADVMASESPPEGVSGIVIVL
jgi:hypothetical protein